MEKKDTPLDKANSSLFVGEKIYFATKHKKEEILAPIFQTIGAEVVAVPVDTDLFGTFTGEIERTGTVKETLRKKISLARTQLPQGRFFLASEGSFGPHPFLPMVSSDLESLMLYDAQADVEIYVEEISTEVVHDEKEISPGEGFETFLQSNQFPSHALIVHPVGSHFPIFKGIHEEHSLFQAMLDCFSHSTNGKIILATDLRANHNPTRRKNISRVAQKMLRSLNSICPRCFYPGFDIVGSVPGLPCAACGTPSSVAKELIFLCAKCQYEEKRSRPDNLSCIEPEGCDFCNP